MPEAENVPNAEDPYRVVRPDPGRCWKGTLPSSGPRPRRRAGCVRSPRTACGRDGSRWPGQLMDTWGMAWDSPEVMCKICLRVSLEEVT